MTPTTASAKRHLGVLLILLLGFALRFGAQATLTQRMGFDDAYYALDASSLIDQPRWTPFFVNNLGRESGWMYFLVPFQLTIGMTPFASHVASAWIGVLTVAAVYRLARRLLTGAGALWAALAMAIVFGHVLLSYVGYRAITYPLVITLALACLLEARRARRAALWAAAGALNGLALYTYFSARALIPLVALLGIAAAARTRQWRSGVLFVLATLLVGASLLSFSLSYSGEANERIQSSARLDGDSLQASAIAWLRAPLIAGDPNLERNLPGRPLFDIALGALWLLGALVSLRPASASYRHRWGGWLVLIGLGLTVLPSLVSYDPPHVLRAIGLFVPSAILAGAGANWLHTRVPRISRVLLPVLFASSTVVTGVDLARWVNHPGQYYGRLTHIHIAADYLRAHSNPNTPVVFSPEQPRFDGLPDAAIRFRAVGLRPRVVSAADPETCFTIPDAESVYANISVSTQPITRSLAQQLAPFASAAPITAFVHRADEVTTYTQTLYAVRPTHALSVSRDGILIGAQGGADFRVNVLNVPARVTAGQHIDAVVAMRALGAPRYDYRMTVALADAPAGYPSRNRWSERDGFVCPIHQTSVWTRAETVFRRVSIDVPADLPGGGYALVFRFYGGIPFKTVEDLFVQSFSANTGADGRILWPLQVDASATPADAAPSSQQAHALSAADGYIREWGLIGGFPGAALNDDVMPGGEAAFDGAVAARPITSQAPKIDLRRWLHPAAHSVTYAYVWLRSPQARRVQLGLNSDDGIAVWLNGREVWRNPASRYVAEPPSDPDVPFVELKPGWNLLLLKISQSDGEWAFQCRLRDVDGVPLRDIEYALQPR